jgi:hypothetical protein
MASNQGILPSFILSLVGGVSILITGIVGLVWFGANGPNWSGFGSWMSGMMNGYHGFMGGGEFGFFTVISILGLISGAAMIAGAVMFRMHPRDHLVWGVFILVFAIVSFVDMGGYFFGAVLGVIGGALALSYRPRATISQPTPNQQN